MLPPFVGAGIDVFYPVFDARYFFCKFGCPNFCSEKIGFLNFQIFPMIHAVYTIANSTQAIHQVGSLRVANMSFNTIK